MYTTPPRIRFGAAYYLEYGHGAEPRDLDRDLDLMAEARFTVIRVGESVWSTWEPDEGVFSLDWLQPVLDGAHARGIDVVIGTPTYAVPPWLARRYPEINAEQRTGARMGWGARQEIDITHGAFRFHAERVIRRIAARYADHPAVVGWQVDNEPGNELLHNHAVHQQFLDHLRRTYGDVDTLNREWGLTYWSHRLVDWNDLWTPDANLQPQYALAWRRFQSRLVTAFIAWQADIVREYARDDQFVTTCISYERRAVADDEVTAALDVTAGNPYYTMQEGFRLPAPAGQEQGWTTNGVWALVQTADRMYSSRRSNFLITETNAQAIGMPWVNQPGYDGQWKQAAWLLVSRGADMVEYWHWHTLQFGAETFWGGVLPHSGRPGRVYREIAELGAEFETAGELVTGLRPHAEITHLFSHDSRYALQEHPMLPVPGTAEPDPRSYQRFADAFYRGGFDAGAQQRLLHVSQLPAAADDLAGFVAEHPVLVAAGVFVAPDALLEFLPAYAAAGGHLLLGPRTGYGDAEMRARTDVQPAGSAQPAGVSYDEFSHLETELPVTGHGGFDLPADAVATSFVEGLVADDGTEVLARYTHPHFGRWPAITTRAHGAGRITVVGTIPGPVLAAELLSWVLGHRADEWRAGPTTTATSATARDGSTVRFLHNYADEAVSLVLPTDVRDVLTGVDLLAGSELTIGPWGVRVLAEPR